MAELSGFVLILFFFIYFLNASGPSQARRVSAVIGEFDFPCGFG
jgi:hypothetical protein